LHDDKIAKLFFYSARNSLIRQTFKNLLRITTAPIRIHFFPATIARFCDCKYPYGSKKKRTDKELVRKKRMFDINISNNGDLHQGRRLQKESSITRCDVFKFVLIG
jgi:hypothetical protein